MGIIAKAIADAKTISSNGNDFAVSAVFVAPAPGLETATVNVLHRKHHTGFDSETGVRVNSKMASVTVSEGILIDASYPTRDANNEITLKGHRVSVADSSGNVAEYMVSENYPDETLGLIVLILIDFE
jgi:hypothetical protein